MCWIILKHVRLTEKDAIIITENKGGTSKGKSVCNKQKKEWDRQTYFNNLRNWQTFKICKMAIFLFEKDGQYHHWLTKVEVKNHSGIRNPYI